MPAHVVRFAPVVEETVFVLGAGFSHAASRRMPLTKELGIAVFQELGRELEAFSDLASPPDLEASGLTFETWLSWLAVRQPYDSEAVFHRRQALFFLVREKIASVVDACQEAARDEGLAPWLRQLIEFAHHGRSGVLTLNYDTLIEGAFPNGLLTDPTGEVTRPGDILAEFPSVQHSYMGSATSVRSNQTLRLWKLHGSIDWYSVLDDVSGRSLERIERPRSDKDENTFPVRVGGRDVFIVPPTTSKSLYFDNARTRFIWNSAAEELRQAARVVFIGYSLPLEDAAVASMIATTLGSAESEIHVVDMHPEPVIDHLTSLGIDRQRINSTDGKDCVARYVQSLCESANQWVLDELKRTASEHPNSPLAIGWKNGLLAPVTRASATDDGTGLLLECGRRTTGANLQRPGTVLPQDVARAQTETLQALGDLTSTESVRALIDGAEVEIAGFLEQLEGIDSDPQGDDWVILRPVGNAPAG